VPSELVELNEGTLVEEHLDALAGGLAALGVLLLARLLVHHPASLVEHLLLLGQPACGGVQVDVGFRGGLSSHSWLLAVVAWPGSPAPDA
jgi:hypothetical protein